MTQASSENTTSLPSPNRRTFLQGTASALALTTAAAIPASAASEASAEITPALLAAYNSWLFMERRLLCYEMVPNNPELRRFAEALVPVNTAADRFHLPLDRDWRDVPPPSTRAARVLAAVDAMSAVTAPEPDPHLAWYAEWKAALGYMNGPGGETVEDVSDLPEYDRALELEELVATTPAATLAGVLVQLRVLEYWHGDQVSLNERDSAGLANALATLERLAGEADHG